MSDHLRSGASHDKFQAHVFASSMSHEESQNGQSSPRNDSTDDIPGFKPTSPPTPPGRRRASGGHQVKHRRTRNGCYTCRNRRVKCDEKHPVCERCSKGNRECTYPEQRPSTKQPALATHGRTSQEPIQDTDVSCEDEGLDEGDPSIMAHFTTQLQIPGNIEAGVPNRPPSPALQKPQKNVRSGNAVSSLDDAQSSSPDQSSVPTSASSDQHPRNSSVSTTLSQDGGPWSRLSQDMHFYLDYHKSHLSYHHYFFKHDTKDFLRTTFIEQAVQYEPLLYAVAGFAAFHHTVKRHDGQIQDFLEYYNKSVSLLRQSLANGEPHTDCTMLTILQLATFEEYLGDWVSLLSHQQAAFRMLLELYDTESILDTELRQRILAWYLRFDLTGSIMSGSQTTASREWFVSLARFYHRQIAIDPTNIDSKIEAAIGDHRVASTDMAALFAKYTNGNMTYADFKSECSVFEEYLDTWYDQLDPVFRDERYQVMWFGGRVKDATDIVDPYQSGGLYQGPLVSFNFMIADWIAIRAMFGYKKALALEQDPPSELPHLALELCRIFEAIEYSPELPAEAILKAQAFLGVASLFLPKDERHTMWCRKKLAQVEGLGHIYPSTFRHRMANLWDLAEIDHWWLPGEKDYPSVVRSVRSVMENRLGDIGPGQRSQDQRDMVGIFANLDIQDGRQVRSQHEAPLCPKLPMNPEIAGCKAEETKTR